MSRPERVAERLNRALHTLFERNEDLYLLGQDIADPYGGAFRVTKGLSGRFPGRVLTTPISESGIVGVANGLALRGANVIVEIMFGDFAVLAFDQMLNFATKSVGMYGERRPMRLVMRCPVGGNRGYGPTHSQSLQKHFIGIPHLWLYELSAFHDPESLLTQALQRGEPAILFEPKGIYGSRIQGNGMSDNPRLSYLDAAKNWVCLRQGESTGSELVVLTPGGTAEATLSAARAVAADTGGGVQVIVPAQLYPVDLDPVMATLAEAGGICIVEESTPGGTWGTEVARHIHERFWHLLPRPVTLLSSRDSVIPAAPHLERQVLVQSTDIEEALSALLAAERGAERSSRRSTAALPISPADTEGPPNQAMIRVPKLNNNDSSYILVNWLVDDGSQVASGDPIVEMETSKAIEELTAPESGCLRQELRAGVECRPGDRVGRIVPEQTAGLTGRTAGGAGFTRSLTEPVTPSTPEQERDRLRDDTGTLRLSRAQQLVGAVVSAAHREIPDAFVLRRARLDTLLDRQRELGGGDSDPLGLLELVVKLVGDLRSRFPLCFGSLVDNQMVRLADEAHVGVTLDAGNGLFVPVIRSVERHSVTEIADQLANMRMQALRATFSESELNGANITVSWNHEPDVVFVQPVIPPGLACALSVGGPCQELRLTEDARVSASTLVHLGLAYDHRLVNGREAASFLAALTAGLEDASKLTALADS